MSSEFSYFFVVNDRAVVDEMLNEAYHTGLVSEDEMALLNSSPEGLTGRDIERTLEVMYRVGILGRTTSQ